MNSLTYWGLRERPFENVRKPKFYFPGQEHKEALARLKYMMDDKNMLLGLLTGEIGSGKTFLSEMFLNYCRRQKKVVTYLENSNFSFEDILREIIFQARPKLRTPNAMRASLSRYQLIQSLKTGVVEPIAKIDSHLVVILDEVQDLDSDCLAKIKMLTNINPPQKNLITVILIGQPELRTEMKLAPYLDQRVSLRYHLNTLKAVEVGPYIQHRLLAAGHFDGKIFSDESVAVINRVTVGIPREINRVCKLVLDRACYLKLRHVSERLVQSVFNDLTLQNGAA